MRNIYQEKEFEKKLKAVDEFEHKYLQLLEKYFALPHFEDIILDKLAAEYGEDTAMDLYSYCTSYLDDADVDDLPQGDANANMDDGVEDNLDDMPPPDPAVAKEEERFRNLCNALCSLSGSIAISLCNLFGSALPDEWRQRAVNMLYLAARAHLYTTSATTELFPGMNFPQALVYAKRAKAQLNAAISVIDDMLEHSPALQQSFTPVKKLFEQNLKATDDLVSAINEIPDNFGDMPF